MFDCSDPYEYCPRELAVHVTSHHFDRAAGYNENNAGFGFKWRKSNGRLFVTVGTFRNSLEKTSTYSGTGGDWPLAGPLSLRVTAGLVTGYEVLVVPFVFPELLVGEKTGLALGYAPRIELGDAVVDSFLSLSLFKRF
ncbi:MAG TPA: hypothetical protein VNM24_14355 [Burkholderiales bacterium]|nr:hypothetical protein [Burkholderiales bacterium]